MAVLVAGTVLWAPAAAFACGGGPSAQNVYSECVPTGSGSKSTSSSAHHSGSGKSSNGSSQPTVSAQTAKALQHTSKQNRRRLAHLLGAYGTTRLHAPSTPAAAATEPSALGSAFDLGSGPTALLIVLAGTAVLLLGGSGVRVWRHRHRA